MSSLHVFGVIPDSPGEAFGYAYPQWEESLPDDASVDEHNAWDDRNPIWGLRDDLGCYLDCDFIECFDDFGSTERLKYVATQLADPTDVEKIESRIGKCKTIILLHENALGGFKSAKKMRSTDSVVYCGKFKFVE